MADPRGRGFSRGNGKWHRPPQADTPINYGWIFCTGTDLPGPTWERENFFLHWNLDRSCYAVSKKGENNFTAYEGWPLGEITKDVFLEPEEVTIQEFYGVGR